MSEWSDWIDRERHSIAEAGRWRAVRLPDSHLISFGSNDYLGLRRHPEVVAAAREAVERWGAGAGSSRLVGGGESIHAELEAELASWKGAERALIFASGYAANLGVLTALGGSGSVIVSDQLNHASIIDGCRLSRSEIRVYPHRDVEALERALIGASRPLVVTETLFSMDGDLAPLGDILEVCQRHHALLITDEAHSVLDDTQVAFNGEMVVRMGTLSKALGSMGGFVAGSAAVVDLLVNRSRTQIFTTALAPPAAAAALAALRIVRSEEGTGLRRRLAELRDRLRPGHPSQIVPVLLGSEEKAMAASRQLEHHGFAVPPIRPPSVPAGTSRLRISLSASHRPVDVDRLALRLATLL